MAVLLPLWFGHNMYGDNNYYKKYYKNYGIEQYYPTKKGKQIIKNMKLIRKYIPDYEHCIGYVGFDNNTIVCMYYNQLYTDDKYGRMFNFYEQRKLLRQKVGYQTCHSLVDKKVKDNIIIRQNNNIVVVNNGKNDYFKMIDDQLSKDSDNNEPIVICHRSVSDITINENNQPIPCEPYFRDDYYYYEKIDNDYHVVDTEIKSDNTCVIL